MSNRTNKYPEFTKQLFTFTTEGIGINVEYRLYGNTNKSNISTRFRKVSNGGSGNNKSCPTFLGNIAERVLSHVYNNVQCMPVNNPGYDFICDKDYKIDVKSACLNRLRYNQLLFHINQNKIADYFICLAFDNRTDLIPLHVWLIPGYIINDKLTITISQSTLSKWSEYEQLIDRIITCCDTLHDKNKEMLK